MNRSLETLDIGDAGLYSPSIVQLAEAIEANAHTALQTLDLNAESIECGPRGVQALARMLRSNTSLTALAVDMVSFYSNGRFSRCTYLRMVQWLYVRLTSFLVSFVRLLRLSCVSVLCSDADDDLEPITDDEDDDDVVVGLKVWPAVGTRNDPPERALRTSPEFLESLSAEVKFGQRVCASIDLYLLASVLCMRTAATSDRCCRQQSQSETTLKGLR